VVLRDFLLWGENTGPQPALNASQLSKAAGSRPAPGWR